VLEYFDAYLLGLTATPAKHTYGFFKQNVVMEYPHERAVADGVQLRYEVYRIRTIITAAGSTIEAAPGTMVGYRDRQTRKMRWEASDEDVQYTGADLDRNVVAIDQIRLIVQTFRDKVLQETFPDRTDVPRRSSSARMTRTPRTSSRSLVRSSARKRLSARRSLTK